MRTLKAIELSNIVCYDDLRIELDKQGVTIVYGRNKDSGQDERKSNGAGKSLPFIMLAEILMDQSPLLDGKHVVKDTFFRKDAMGAVEWDDYRLEKSIPAKTPKFDMYKQVAEKWVPTKDRTTKYIQSKLSQLMPLSSDEFFALYYVDSNRPSALQRGSHSTRLQLFSKLFNLDKYDLIQADVKERIKELRREEVKLGVVLNQIATLEPQIPDDLDTKLEELATKRDKQTKLNRRRTEAARLLNMSTTYHAHAKSLSDLDKFWKTMGKKMGKLDAEADWLDPEFLQEFIQAAREGHVAIKKALTKAYAQQAAVHKVDDSRKRVDKLKAQTKGWTLTKIKQALAEAREHADQLSDHRAELKEITRALTSLQPVDEPEHGYEGSRTILKTAFPDVKLNQLLAHARSELNGAQAVYDMAVRAEKNFKAKFDSEQACKCPTCHAELDEETITEISSNLRKVTKDKQKQLEDHQRVFDVAFAFISWTDFTTEHARLTAKRDELAEPEEYDGPDVDKLTDIRSALTELAREEETLAELEELLVGPTPDLEELSDRQMAYKNAQLCAEAVLGSWRGLAEAVEAEAGDYDRKQLEQGLEKADRDIERLMKDVPALTQQVSLAQQAQRQLDQQLVEKKRLEKALYDMPILKAFDDAYGQKGLKNLAIQRVCQTIEQNMNVNASLLYDEPIKFSIEVSETQVNIMAHREWQKEDSVTDIRRLSGAESRAINLLLPMSILPLIPAERRLNIMVLDEPTANLDEPAIEMFTNKFLPKLRELVPHIIVLSPLQLPIDIDDAETLLVTRENGRSTIEKVG